MTRCVCLLVVLWVIGPGVVQAKECRGLSAAQREQVENVYKSFTTVFSDPKGAPCSSLASVVDKVITRKKVGGRRLETDKPLSVKDAQANLEVANRNAEVRGRLQQLARDVPDEKVRLIYEAAILDDEGYYAARDLKIQQLLDQLK